MSASDTERTIWTFYSNDDCTGDSTTDRAYAQAHGFKTYTSTKTEFPFAAGTCIFIDAHGDRAVPSGSSKHHQSRDDDSALLKWWIIVLLNVAVIGVLARLLYKSFTVAPATLKANESG